MLKYLLDLARAQRDDWSNGMGWTDEARIRVEFLEDFANIDLESIESFYEAIEERDGKHE